MLLRAALMAGVAVIAGSATAATAKEPTLRLTSTTPVKIRGAHFAPSERTRLRVRTADAHGIRHAHANAHGAFVAGLGTIPYDPCSSWLIVRARGSAGSLATLKLPQRQCPPA